MPFRGSSAGPSPGRPGATARRRSSRSGRRRQEGGAGRRQDGGTAGRMCHSRRTAHVSRLTSDFSLLTSHFPPATPPRPLLRGARLLVPRALGAQERGGLADLGVPATRSAAPADRVPSPATVLDGAELRRRGVRLVADALREVPSVLVVPTGS